MASLGLPDDAPARLSARLAEVLHQRLEVPPDRLFLLFHDQPRSHWGWNGRTFG
ncbi:MAG: hypothetical protein D6766_10545 [Verrucomicrobia bacterium]|nr:MAG: hypothetical protein D6766_10545 [Verrucomicrobiota bacterium]